MNHNNNFARGVTLLTFSGLLCLSIGSAQCQRAGRQSGRATTGQTTTSSSQMGSCPNGGSSSGTSTSTGTTTTTGTTTSSAVASLLASRQAAQQSAQSGLTAQRSASNQLTVQWSGNTNSVRGVYLGLLDANGQVVAQQAVSQMPVRASFALTSSARYYAARVVYSNGTSSMVYQPIR